MGLNMNSFQTPTDPKLPASPKPKKKTSKEMDELCGTPLCGDMLRNHIHGVCGVFPCTCTKFTPTGKFYNWSPDANS
jgi:hypothetical protein